jgi:hypothetical protein
MPDVPLGRPDRRRKGIGNNVAKPHAHIPHAKQASAVTPKTPVGKSGASPKMFAHGAGAQSVKMATPVRFKAGV